MTRRRLTSAAMWLQAAHTRYLYLNFLAGLLAERGSAAPDAAASPDLREALACLQETAEAMAGAPEYTRSLPTLHQRIADLSLAVGEGEQARAPCPTHLAHDHTFACSLV
jgi:hypothetical protein